MEAAKKEPQLLLRSIKTFDDPATVMHCLSDQVIVALTTGWRIECMLATIKAWEQSGKDEELKQQLREWRTSYELRSGIRTKLACLDDEDRWNWVRHSRMGKDAMMQLCDPNARIEGSYQILVAKVFEEEIKTLLDSRANLGGTSTYSCIWRHLSALQHHVGYKASYEEATMAEDWSLLPLFFAKAISLAQGAAEDL